jgi:phage gp29-like protein
MSTKLKPEDFPSVMEMVNLTYTDGLDSIGAAKVEDDGTIIAVGVDGNKILAIKVGTDNKIAVRLANQPAASGQTGQFAAMPVISQESIIDRLKETGDQELGSWLNTVKDMLLTSDSLTEARESLFSVWPDLEADKLEATFSNALTLASMAGYFEAGEDE